jgi:hypothetical protein
MMITRFARKRERISTRLTCTDDEMRPSSYSFGSSS